MPNYYIFTVKKKYPKPLPGFRNAQLKNSILSKSGYTLGYSLLKTILIYKLITTTRNDNSKKTCSPALLFI